MYTFETAFEKVADVSVNVEEFHNGTGYFDTLCNLDLGDQIQKFTDSNGRRGLILPVAPALNIVIFERYKDKDVLVANVPSGQGLQACLNLDGQVSDDTLAVLLGSSHYATEGERIPQVAKMAAALTKAVTLRQQGKRPKVA